MADIISNDAVREIITIASQQGILSQKDVDNTIAHSNETGKPMSSILFERNLMDEQSLASFIASSYGLQLTEIDPEGINEEELAFTKNSIANSDALRYETAFQKSRFLARIQRYGLDGNYTKKQKEMLNDMTVADVKSIANKYLKMDDHIVVVVGNKYALKDKLQKFGKVTELKIK